jgi:hypothetical protein
MKTTTTTTIGEYFNEYELHVTAENGSARINDAGSEITITGEGVESSDEAALRDRINAEDFEVEDDDDGEDDAALDRNHCAAWKAINAAAAAYYSQYEISIS